MKATMPVNPSSFSGEVLSLLRDVLLSFCPAEVRRTRRPASTARVVDATIVTGILQALIFAVLIVVHFKSFMLLRSQQLGKVMSHAAPEVQAGANIILTLDFLINPVSMLLIYFTLEGFLRFLSGLFFAEVLPSGPAFLVFKLFGHRRPAPAPQIADTFEMLLDGDRLRIASAQPKTTWNSTITIDIGGQWYEVENAENGMPPREHVYILRPAPMGKILRKYEEYIPPDLQPPSNENTRTPT
jgi:hypothetical protein